MENASKALIIAGAILLAILIISLGIMVYQNAKNTVSDANLDSQSIETFNSQWESYVGSSKSASDVSTLISAVIASNASEKKSGSTRIVGLTTSSTGNNIKWSNNGSVSWSNCSSISTVPTTINAGITYTISATYNSTSGLINTITIKANS